MLNERYQAKVEIVREALTFTCPMGPEPAKWIEVLGRVRKTATVTIVLVCTSLLGSCRGGRSGTPYSWNADAAAHYLDQREARWATWHVAARDHDTFCVSCHTALSYALVRPAIPAPDEEKTAAQEEARLIQNVQKRVRLWNQVEPYYRGKDDESRGTESVLNAVILATNDERHGGILSPDTRAAFDHMWALQKTSGEEAGTWSWLEFRQEPWEARDSNYYGACLAALAVGSAPDEYRNMASVQVNVKLLRAYLVHNFAAQTPINHVTLLWASLKWPGLIRDEAQRSIIDEIYKKQRNDGGWSLASLIGKWTRTDGTPLVLKSDGYSTGLITYVLQESGVPRDNPQLQRGLEWLSRNQSWWDGHWSAYSLNKRRHDPFSNVSQFMNDAATAYAALALTTAERNWGNESAASTRGPAHSGTQKD
jgi:squalene-hopene/tetraprenyl-beta-curcumene cyclase